MSISPEEAVQIKSDIEVLKNSTTQCLQATENAAKASQLVAEQISNLLLEMKEHDIREEYRAEELKQLRGSIDLVNNKIDEYIPVLTRAKSQQDFNDGIKAGMSSTAGKLAMIAAIIGAMYLLGINPPSFIK